MNALLIKAFRDVTRRRVRSGLTLAAILIGVAGVVAIISTGQALASAQSQAYSNASQSDITFWVWDASDTASRALASQPNITAAELRVQFFTRCQWGNGEWRDVLLYGFEDFPNAQINRIALKEGRWPNDGEFVAETSTRALYPAQAGDTLTCRAREGGRGSALTLTGFAETPNYPSAALLNYATVYAPARDVEKLLGVSGANQLLLKVADYGQIARTAADARQLMDRRGLQHDNGQIRDPRNFLGKRELDALLLLLSVFSGVGLLTSAILVANTLAAITAEQVGEIGTIKALGGTRLQVLSIYLVSSALYGLGGTAIGLIAGVGAAWLLLSRIGGLLNLETILTVSPVALGAGALLGMGVTLIAGAIPSLAATRVPVKEALEAYGISSTYGRGWVDRALRRLAFLPPLVAMSVRNLARRKARSVVTVTVIAVAVATSLAAQSVSVSVDRAVDGLFETYRADAWLLFGEYVSTATAGQIRATPGVTAVETWSLQDAWVSTARGDARPLARSRLWGLPAGTTLYIPQLVAGRWYRSDEPDAAVISTDLAQTQGLRLGDVIRVAPGSDARDYRVVGIVVDNSVFLGSTVAGKVFLNEDQVASLQRREGWTTFFAVAFAQHDVPSIEAGLDTLARRFNRYALTSSSAAREVQGAKDQSRLLTAALVAMSLIIGAIGALGVANTLILNVLERRREIGVLRSIGASDGRLVEGFLTEGIAFGLVGWAAGVLLGYPLGLLLTRTMESVLFQIEYIFSPAMIALSLGFALLIAGGASLFPGLAAARLKVNQILRYE